MIDWEDFDWRKVVAAIALAIIIISGAVYVINDNVTARRVQTSLNRQLQALADFEQAYQPPSQEQLDQLNAQLESLRAKAAKMPVKLQDQVDTPALETRVKNLAAACNVNLDKFEVMDESKDRFLKIYPLAMTALGANENLSKFIGGIQGTNPPWRWRGTPASSEGRIAMVMEFLAFDQQEWDQAYSCNITVKPPENIDTDLSKIRIFKTSLFSIDFSGFKVSKTNLEQLKEQLDAEQAKMADVKNVLAEQCQLQREIAGMETKIQRLEELRK